MLILLVDAGEPLRGVRVRVAATDGGGSQCRAVREQLRLLDGRHRGEPGQAERTENLPCDIVQCAGLVGLFRGDGIQPGLTATIAQKWRLRLVPEQRIEVQPKITLRPKFPIRMVPEPRA